MFLRKTDRKYDCVMLDAFSIGGRIPFHLVTREFLESCRDKMTDDGVFIMNINSATRRAAFAHLSLHAAHARRGISQHLCLCEERSAIPAARHSMNVILVATRSKEPITADEWVIRAERFQPKSYVGPPEMRQMAQALVVEPLNVADTPPLFTDDYAPIETMPFY